MGVNRSVWGHLAERIRSDRSAWGHWVERIGSDRSVWRHPVERMMSDRSAEAHLLERKRCDSRARQDVEADGAAQSWVQRSFLRGCGWDSSRRRCLVGGLKCFAWPGGWQWKKWRAGSGFYGGIAIVKGATKVKSSREFPRGVDSLVKSVLFQKTSAGADGFWRLFCFPQVGLSRDDVNQEAVELDKERRDDSSAEVECDEHSDHGDLRLPDEMLVFFGFAAF